jgi:hypothetical protein
MKYLVKATRRLAVCLLAVLWCAGATPVVAQARFVTVDYMKVAPGADGVYLQLEQKTWKPLHEARIKAGNAAGWYLYRVLSPSGTEVHHNYVTVAIYDSFEAMENPFPRALFDKVHPGVNMADFDKRTVSARDLVRSETWQWVAQTPEAQLATPAPYLSVESMRVPMGGDAAYAEVERLWRKIHDVRIKDGTLSSWGLLTRVFPAGSDYPFNYVTVNGYSRFKDVNGFDMESVVARAGLGLSVSELSDKTAKARDLARAELWVLVDYVQASGQQERASQ